MLKKITLDNFRSFKNRVTVELTKTSYNMLSHNAADNGVLKGCIFVGANGSGKSTIIRGFKLLLDLLFSEKILDLGSFLCVFGERRQYSVEYEFIVENEVIVSKEFFKWSSRFIILILHIDQPVRVMFPAPFQRFFV